MVAKTIKAGVGLLRVETAADASCSFKVKSESGVYVPNADNSDLEYVAGCTSGTAYIVAEVELFNLICLFKLTSTA